MDLAITIVLILVLLLLTLVGAWRDIPRGMLALAGTLFGAIVSSFWAARWGSELASRFALPKDSSIFVTASLLLIGTALVLGYGGGILLPSVPHLATWRERLIGGVLGMLNAIILVGYVLQYGVGANQSFAELIATTPLVKLLYEELPRLFLVIAFLGVVAVVVKSLMLTRSGRAFRTPVAVARSTPSSSNTTSRISETERRINRQRVVEKINDRIQQ